MTIPPALLASMLDGDTTALQTLKTLYEPRLRMLIKSYKLTHDEVDDLFQEFVIRLFATGTLDYLLLSKHPAPAKVLSSVLKRVAIDRVRYWSSDKRDLLRDEPLDDALESSLEWGASDHGALSVELEDVLAHHLSEGERDLAELIDSGKRSREIAEHYGVNVSTASRWCIKLGVKLRQILENPSMTP